MDSAKSGYKQRLTIINVVLIFVLLWSVVSIIRLSLSGFNCLLMTTTVSFSILLLVSSNIKKSLCKLDFLTLYVTFYMFIRYVLYPYFFCISESNSFYELHLSYEASFLFIVEALISIVLFNKLLSGLPQRNDIGLANVSAGQGSIKMMVLLLLASVVLYARIPSIPENYKFVWDLSIIPPEDRQLTSFIDSIAYVVIDVTRLLCPLVIISSCYKHYMKNGNGIYIFFSFLACVLPLLLIKNMNRGSSFFTSLIYVWMVCNLYGWKKSKGYAISIISVIVLLLALVSAVKHATSIEEEGASRSNVYETVQGYTLGVESIRYGLVTNESYSMSNRASVFFNDCFASLPILNRFANATQRYTDLYNTVYYASESYNKNDAIAPILTHMLFVFSVLGLFVPLIFMICSVKCYKKALKANSLNLVFIFCYMAVVLDAGRVGSFSATLATLIWSILPLALVVRLSSKKSWRVF